MTESWWDDHGDADGEAWLSIPAASRPATMWDPAWFGTGRRRLLRMDLRDQGLSGRDESTYGFDDLVADAVGVLDASGTDGADLVGAELGASIALAMAARHPARVRSVVAVAPTAWFVDPAIDGPREETVVSFTLRQRRDSDEDLIRTLTRHLQVLGGDAADFDHEATLREVGEWVRRGMNPLDQHRRVLLEMVDLAPELERVTTPVTVIHGEADPHIRLAHGLRVADVVPDCRVITVPGAAHRLEGALLAAVRSVVGQVGS